MKHTETKSRVIAKTLPTKMASEWRKDHAGRYVSSVSGWIIERSEDSRLWNVVNPATGQVFDTANSLNEGKRNYSNIGKPLIECGIEAEWSNDGEEV